MIDLFRPIAEACSVQVPPEHRRRIALVGAGAIADVAHLPAYRRRWPRGRRHHRH